MQLHTLELPPHWQARVVQAGASLAQTLASPEGWHAAQVPGNVYQDLLQQGLIADPHFGRNEQDVQWVAERDWCYRLDFTLTSLPTEPHVELVFEGLDTFAQVWLNDSLLLESRNMFVPARVDVKALLKPGPNRLVLLFAAALRVGREIEAPLAKLPLWNGDSSRLYVRKAPYHYGWDWGPVLLTAGPWQPITCQAYGVRIAELHSPIVLSADLQQAELSLTTQLVGQALGQGAGQRLQHRLFDPAGQLIATHIAPAQASQQTRLQVARPRLWWPAGHGEQALYCLTTELLDAEGRVLDACSRRLGMRQIKLRQDPVAGELGRSFHFEVNGQDFFVGGANWIPDDNLLNRISRQRYFERVQQALDGNLGMLRVWGGGIYEAEAFYDACDELGILVWQDFLFACGVYPAHQDFQANVEAEAVAAVKRLRHRPSLAIWCGNNEDYAIAESVGRYGPGKEAANFPARVLYEQVLARVCASLDPGRPYWPGSPFSPADPDLLERPDSPAPVGASAQVLSSDPRIGDRHSWEVWHGPMAPYQDFHKYQGRFVSEFGMQSHPSLPVLESCLPEAERHPHSRTLLWHNKAGTGLPDGHRRLAVYLADNLRCGSSLAEHVYATQFVQAEAMRYAYQDFRRRWQRPGARAVGGALVWQLNDCWPASSWAVIDAAGVLKPAWHSIRRAMAPRALAVRLQDGRVHAWVMNSQAALAGADLQLQLFNLAGDCLHAAGLTLDVIANGSSEAEFALPELGQPCVASVRLCHAGVELATDAAWPEPFKFHDFPLAGLRAQRGDGSLCLQVERPLKGLWLSAPGLRVSDNFIDLLPGRPLTVQVQQATATPIQLQALAHEAWSVA